MLKIKKFEKIDELDLINATMTPKKLKISMHLNKDHFSDEEKFLKVINNKENYMKSVNINESQMKEYADYHQSLQTQELPTRNVIVKNQKNEYMKKQMNEFKKYLELKEHNLKKLRNNLKKKPIISTNYLQTNNNLGGNLTNTYNKIKLLPTNKFANFENNQEKYRNVLSPKTKFQKFNEKDSETCQDIIQLNSIPSKEKIERLKKMIYNNSIIKDALDFSKQNKNQENLNPILDNKDKNTIEYYDNENQIIKSTLFHKMNNHSYNKINRKDRDNSLILKKPDSLNFPNLKHSIMNNSISNNTGLKNREKSDNHLDDSKFKNILFAKNLTNKGKINVSNSIISNKTSNKMKKMTANSSISPNLINLNQSTTNNYQINKTNLLFDTHKNSINKNNSNNIVLNKPQSSNFVNNFTKKKLIISSSNKDPKFDNYAKDSEYYNFMDIEDEKQQELTNDERSLYGNREPKDYKKIKILGKGGCGIVWLCKNNENEYFALKQIPKKIKSQGETQNSVNSIIARKERELLLFLQANKESLRTDEMEENDFDNFINLVETIEDNYDIWLIFEKGGRSLSSLMFRIKGEFLGNERIYLIQKGIFMQHLFSDIINFKEFFKIVLKFINQLSNKFSIIHSDIKPENILIDYEYDNDLKKVIYKSFKIIDFGSAFFIDNPENFASNTPEYMSPEITDLIEKNSSNKDVVAFLKNLKTCPTAIDIWSLGVMILEMLVCCPLWMNYKAKVILRGKICYKTGLFGVKGREGNRIYNKQIELANNLPRIFNNIIIEDENDKNKLMDLLSKMLDVNYKTRINPTDAMNHPFFDESCEN